MVSRSMGKKGSANIYVFRVHSTVSSWPFHKKHFAIIFVMCMEIGMIFYMCVVTFLA
jgi:hypothetical protein